MSTTSPEPAQSTTSPTASSSSSSKPKSQTMSVTAATDRQIAEARGALEASMHNIGSHLDSTLKSRAQNLHANNAAVDKQIAELESSTRALAKETDKLKRVADDAARKLKEVGNVQNWAEVMEREFLILEETVRLADLSEEEDYGPCRVCGQRVEESGDELLWCRGCEGEFHPPCVGLEGVPMGEWSCAECQQQGTYLQSVKTDTVGQVVVNGGDVEMSGMENGVQDKGKGKETGGGKIDSVSASPLIVNARDLHYIIPRYQTESDFEDEVQKMGMPTGH